MFSWCFSQILNCLLQLWEKKKNVCKSFQIFQRDLIGHKVQLLYTLFYSEKKNVFGNLKCLGKLSLKYRCRTTPVCFPDIIILASTFSKQTSSLGHCRDIGHVWTAALGLILESEHFFLIISGEEMWILELQNDSKMLNVSLRRPPFHTCSSNKDPLSHIYFLQWILSQSDSQQGVKLGVFFIFRCMYTSKLQTQDSCFLSFELVTLLFKSSSILFCPNYNGVDAN